MRAFVVTIETPLRRRVQVVADGAEDAARAARRTIGARSRVVDVALVARNDQDAGIAALRFLLTQPYLDLAGAEATVFDWLAAARQGHEGPTGPHNAVLAMAGLRVTDGDLAVGSAGSIPTLADWMADTAFHGQHLVAALARLPGAARSVLTYCGQKSKAVILPWGVAAQALAGHDRAAA